MYHCCSAFSLSPSKSFSLPFEKCVVVVLTVAVRRNVSQKQFYHNHYYFTVIWFLAVVNLNSPVMNPQSPANLRMASISPAVLALQIVSSRVPPVLTLSPACHYEVSSPAHLSSMDEPPSRIKEISPNY